MNVFSARDAKNAFGRLLDEAAAAPVTIEKHGRAVAVVMSVRQHEAIRDEIEGLHAKLNGLHAEYSNLYTEIERLRAAQLDPPPVDPPSVLPTDAPGEPEETAPLHHYDLGSGDGRLSFLGALYFDYQEQGLLMAVNHVWNSLGAPKATRCEAMAARLGLRGRGKTALRHVLERFLQETLYEMQIDDIPPIADFPDFDSWNAVCRGIFDRADADYSAIARRFEAILDGREPEVPTPPAPIGRLIKGPWRRVRSTPVKE